MSRTARVSLFLFASILLLFTIFPASVFTFAKHQEALETDPYQENLVVDDKDVVVLTEKNFSDFIATNQYALVDFYASWCFWSRKLAPEYSAAATILKGEAVVAKVEASEQRELGRQYDIQGYPTVLLFVDGIPKTSYYGERTRDAISTWVRQKTGLVVQTVSTTEEAEGLLSANSLIVMGFLDTLEGPETTELAAAAKLHVDINIYQTDNVDVARFLGIDPQFKRPALIMLRKEVSNYSYISFDGQFNGSAISDFVSVNKLPLVITFTEEEDSRISKNHMRQLWLFAPKSELKLIGTFEKAAKAFREKLLFVYVETNDFGLGACRARRFGVPEGSPGVVAYIPKGRSKYVYRGELTFVGIKSFAEEFLEDKLSLIPSVPTSKTLLRLPPDSHNSNPSLFPNA